MAWLDLVICPGEHFSVMQPVFPLMVTSWWGSAAQRQGSLVRHSGGPVRGGMAGLGMLPGNQDYIPSKARGVSADGNAVIGFSGSVAGAQAFCWRPGDGLMGLGDLPGGAFSSEALGVSADGQVVVGFANSEQGQEAFRWTRNGGMVDLGTFRSGYFYSEAFDTSADGSTVVGYGLGDRGQEAFLWDATYGMRNLREVLIKDYGLELTGWALKMAKAVSDDGMTIVGKGVNPDGKEEAWLVQLDASPL